MRSELLLIEKIEQYLEGTLSPADHTSFEKEMAGNIDLQNEVSLQRELISGLQRTALKKDVAVAFLKYKKMALLFKLGMIGASAIVGTAVTVAVVHYTNTDTSNKENNNSSTTQIVQIDSTEQNLNDSALDEVTPIDSSQNNENHISENSNTYNYSTGTAEVNQNNSTKESPKSTSVNPSAKTTANAETTPAKTKNDSTNTPPKTPSKPMSRKMKDARLADLFWMEGVPITWLGLDFTNARLLGKFSEITNSINNDSAKTANNYFKQWNEVILVEKRKNNLTGALRNKHVQYAVDYINRRNDTIKAQRLFVANSSNLNHLNNTSIQKIVNTYNLEGKDGLGLVFIVESLDKTKQKGAAYAAIIDMKTNEILLTEKIVADPHGKGLKNYWANSFSNMIVEIEARKFPEWKKKYKK